jgi:hypothetical protein
LFSNKILKLWERETGKNWYKLTYQERKEANKMMGEINENIKASQIK